MIEGNGTQCPLCDSDDYECLEEDADGLPDYNGEKRCNNCGEIWV